ncbi:MAG: hypothetical protein SangKO_066990 [Sandaracinaceae bacterium]|nr:helix-turn-helix domain-containing protein [Myxococcales bacterium]
MTAIDSSEIRDLRHRIGLTQAQLAALLGVHVMTISRWERGEVVPDGPAAHLLLALRDASAGRTLAPAHKDEVLRTLAAGAAVGALVALLIAVFANGVE